MKRKFNTTGMCIPSLHYMADTSELVSRIIADYIEQGEYVAIARARQFGKMTTLELLYRRLKETYFVIDFSFEAADEYFQSLGALVKGLHMDISERLEEQGAPSILRKAWDAPVSARTRSMGRTDVIVDFLGQQYIIEMKIYRGNEYYLRGEEQLAGYLEDYHLQKGYLLSFNFNQKKKVGVRKVMLGDKVLVEAVV